MKLINEQDIIRLVEEDNWMMDILKTAKSMNLPDWWICAGFVRSKIWDTLHHFKERTALLDVDVIYFDKSNLDERVEKQLENKLKHLNPSIPWSVKNEARMHMVNDLPPYESSTDAMSKFPETATALGLTLDDQNNVILAAPCGIQDVLDIVIRPTPYFLDAPEKISIYEKRIVKKNWKAIWYKVKVAPINKFD